MYANNVLRDEINLLSEFYQEGLHFTDGNKFIQHLH